MHADGCLITCHQQAGGKRNLGRANLLVSRLLFRGFGGPGGSAGEKGGFRGAQSTLHVLIYTQKS